jgi:hypothetical protein
MIQRKQTLWLALFSIICFSCVYFNIPFRDVEGKLDGKVIDDAMASIGFSYTSIDIVGKDRVRTEDNPFLKYCTLLLGLLPLASIFLYKKRHNQLLIGKLIYLVIILMTGLMFYYGWSKRYVDLEPDGQILIFILIPVLLAWANYKAIAGIRKDDALVKSYDRIR